MIKFDSNKILTGAVILVVVFFNIYYIAILNHDNENIKTGLAQITKNLNNTIDDLGYLSKEENLNKYGGSALQIAGTGSRFAQVEAHYLTEHGYLHPADEYISYAFNGPADMMHISCRKGYKITLCEGEEEGSAYFDKENNLCTLGIQNKMQNWAMIECEKE